MTAAADMSYSATQVDELLKCPICLDRYSQPKQLPCQHTVCKSPCLTGLLSQNPRVMNCPQCRAMHVVPPGGVAAFPDNFIINNLLDLPTTQNNALVSAFKCLSCATTENLSLCNHCNKQICSECRSSHVETVRDHVRETIAELRQRLPNLSLKMAEFNRKTGSIRSGFDSVQADITSAFNDHIQELEARKQSLITELNLVKESHLHSHQHRQEAFELELASATSFCESAEQEIDNCANATVFSTMSGQCTHFLKTLQDLPRPDPTSVSMSFVRDDDSVSRGIQTYGRISTGNNRSHTNTNTTTNTANRTNATTNRSNPFSSSRTQSYMFSIPPPTIPSRQTPRRLRMSAPVSYSPYFAEEPNRTHSNFSSLFGPYMTAERTTESPLVPTHAQANLTHPPPAEAFSGFISLENPNFRRRRRQQTSSRGQVSSNARHRGHSQNNSSQSVSSRRNSHPTGETVRPNIPLERRETFIREDNEDDDDDIITTNSSRRPISFQIPLNDTPPIPPRTPNSLETIRPVNNYQQKHVFKCLATRRGQAYFTAVTGVTVAPDTDNIYAVDNGASKILIFDTNGRFIKSFTSEENSSQEFFDACFQGEILYVTDPSNNSIHAFSIDGYPVAFTTGHAFQSPHGITSDGDRLYVCDTGHGRVCCLGETVSTVQCEQMEKPMYISLGRDRIIVSDPLKHSIFIFDMDGSLLKRFGQQGSAVGYLSAPQGVTIDFQGFILVANSQNFRIDVFRENGIFFCTFGDRGDEAGRFVDLRGITVASNGRVIISDSNRIQIF